MTHESDVPQRIPKRPVQEGRAVPAEHSQSPSAAQPALDVDGAKMSGTDESRLPADSAGHVEATGQGVAKRATRRSAKPRVRVAQVTTAPRLQTKAADPDTSAWGRFRAWMIAAPALSLSLLLHLAAFVALGAATFVAWEPEKELLITASSVDVNEAPIEELTEIDMGELEDFEEETFEEEVAEMSEMVLDDVSIDAPIAEAIPDVVGTAPPVGSRANKGEKSEAKPTQKSSKKGGKAVSFYGSKATGNRFVFLIDNSPNMNDEGRMLMALQQLLNAVDQMSPKQEFYVMFYSNKVYPLYFPETAAGPVPANRANKKMLRAWLDTVELCDSRPGGSSAVQEMLLLSNKLRPSTLFFLTDGDYATAVERVLKEETSESTLNVIGLTPLKMDPRTHAKLSIFADLAKASRGTFVPMPAAAGLPSGYFRERSKKKPGPVWGTYQ